VRRSIIEAGQEVDVPDFGRQVAAHPEKGTASKT
jgi:cyclohexadieny/prephenate dehydrogenase